MRMDLSYENYVFYRNQRGLSDYQLAKNAGIGRAILSDWKNGKHYPYIKTLKKIADALGVTVNDFYATPKPLIQYTGNSGTVFKAKYVNHLFSVLRRLFSIFIFKG